jgi:hypothetical protein
LRDRRNTLLQYGWLEVLIQLLLCEKLINLIPSQEGLHSDILKVNDLLMVCVSLPLFSAGELLIDSSAATALSSRGERAA